MTPRLPPLALLLGLGGLIPFLACGLGSVTAGGAVPADRALLALIEYAAIILSFLGAVHWGLALATQDHAATAQAGSLRPGSDGVRLALGVLPALLGWAALLVSVAAAPAIALALLIAGFLATTAVEARGARDGLVPAGYMRMRWLLTLVVVLVLAMVLLSRVTGLAVQL
jgi:hypothetical protein